MMTLPASFTDVNGNLRAVLPMPWFRAIALREEAISASLQHLTSSERLGLRPKVFTNRWRATLALSAGAKRGRRQAADQG